MKQWLGILLLVSSVSSAATLEDVNILDIKQGPQNVELKLQSKVGASDSYFYVDIVKEDSESFEKMAQVLNKLTHKGRYRLDLEIPSFSASPNGSYYRSERVRFVGAAGRPKKSSKVK